MQVNRWTPVEVLKSRQMLALHAASSKGAGSEMPRPPLKTRIFIRPGVVNLDRGRSFMQEARGLKREAIVEVARSFQKNCHSFQCEVFVEVKQDRGWSFMQEARGKRLEYRCLS